MNTMLRTTIAVLVLTMAMAIASAALFYDASTPGRLVSADAVKEAQPSELEHLESASSEAVVTHAEQLTSRAAVSSRPQEHRRGSTTRQSVRVVNELGAGVANATIYWASRDSMKQAVRAMGAAARDISTSPVRTLTHLGRSEITDGLGCATIETELVPPFYVAATTSEGWGLGTFTAFDDQHWVVEHEMQQILRISSTGGKDDAVPVMLGWTAPVDQSGVVNAIELGRLTSPGTLTLWDYEQVEARVRGPRPDATNFEVLLAIAGKPLSRRLDGVGGRHKFGLGGMVLRQLEVRLVDSEGRAISEPGRLFILNIGKRVSWFSLDEGVAVLPCAAVGEFAELEFAFERGRSWRCAPRIPEDGPLTLRSERHGVIAARLVLETGEVPGAVHAEWSGGECVPEIDESGRLHVTLPTDVHEIGFRSDRGGARVALGELSPLRTTDLGRVVVRRGTTISIRIVDTAGNAIQEAQARVREAGGMLSALNSDSPFKIMRSPGSELSVIASADGFVEREVVMDFGEIDEARDLVLEKAITVRGEALIPANFAADVGLVLKSVNDTYHVPSSMAIADERVTASWDSVPAGGVTIYLVSMRPPTRLASLELSGPNDGEVTFEIDARDLALRHVELVIERGPLSENMVIGELGGQPASTRPFWLSRASHRDVLALEGSRSYLLAGPHCKAVRLSGSVASPCHLELLAPTGVQTIGANRPWHVRPIDDQFDLDTPWLQVRIEQSRFSAQQTSLGAVLGERPSAVFLPGLHEVVVSEGYAIPDIVSGDRQATVELRDR